MLFAYVNLSMAIAALLFMILMHLVDVWKRQLIRQIKGERVSSAVGKENLGFNI